MSSNACANLASLSSFFGISAVLVNSQGRNACSTDSINYGGYYAVIRTWALNIPIYVQNSTNISIARSIILRDGSVFVLLLSKPSQAPVYNEWRQWKSGSLGQKELEKISKRISEEIQSLSEIQPESNDSEQNGSVEIASELEPAEQENAKPAQQKCAKPAQQKCAKPAQQKSAKPAQQKSAKPAEQENAESAEQGNVESAEQENAESAEQENIESAEQGNVESADVASE